MGQLTNDQETYISALYDANVKKIDIIRMCGLKQSTVYSFLQRYSQRGNKENLPRPGRPREFGVRVARRHRMKSLDEIKDLFNAGRNRTFSKRTIERKLHDDGYHKRTVKKAIRIRAVNKRNRMAWCRGNLHKTLDAYWNKVIFSDECKVIIGQDTRVRVWRKVGEEYLPDYICPPSKRKLTLMIWGCITYHGIGTICVVDGKIYFRVG
jgi:transposase